MQSRLDSLIEVLISVVIGFVISLAANAVILPMVGLSASLAQNATIGLLMTIISVARGYIIRRWAQQYLTEMKNHIVNFFTKEVK